MIRVVLPFHLRNLARVDGEVELEVAGPVTVRAVLDALEARYPGVARDDSRSRHVEAPAVREVFRLQGRFVARTAGDEIARRGRQRRRAVPDRRRHGRRLNGTGIPGCECSNTGNSEVVEHLFRHESGKMVATLTGIFGIEHLTLAEDVVQEALARALQTWPFYGVPKNPAAWIMRASRNLALDVVRRQKVFRDKEPEIIRLMDRENSAPDTAIFPERKSPMTRCG